MSGRMHDSRNNPKGEIGAMTSYVYGFILSLVFTAIPYYLVVTKAVSGTALLATILAFAVLQMLVQLVFFLHLGRGPKPLYNVVFYAATVSAILVVTVGSVFIMGNLHGRMSPDEVTLKLAEDEGISQLGGEPTGACKGRQTNHKITIRDGKVSTPQTVARLCDTLTFINDDAEARRITFGMHPQQDSYGGETELLVTNRRHNSITLNQTGTYMFHDHQDPGVLGYFTVSP